MPIPRDKKTLRLEVKRVRTAAQAMLGVQAAEDAAAHGLKLMSGLSKSAVIGGYWPIGTELDPRILMHQLEQAGYTLSLPVVTNDDAPLTFRLWGAGDPLVSGAFGTQTPTDDAPQVVPDALIVPLLAFDEDCFRLGYGGGFYDRTLAAHPHMQAFGFAYAAQLVDDMVKEQHDWPLHAVITEAGTLLPRAKK
jgi:5-formyltetrahydrofolate cyclo-ligase